MDARELRIRREALRLTQTQFAQRIGWHQSHVNAAENGTRSVPAWVEEALAAQEAKFARALVEDEDYQWIREALGQASPLI